MTKPRCILKTRFPRRVAFCGRMLNIDKAYASTAEVKDPRCACAKCLQVQRELLSKVRDLKQNQLRGRPANDY